MAMDPWAFPGHDEEGVRALICLGVTQTWFDSDPSILPGVGGVIKEAFSGLRAKFGIEVLGTIDDDSTMVGAAQGWPWTGYMIVHAPSREAVAALCNLVRVTEVRPGERVWKFMKIEARIGHSLFCGES
jgi:hypothetical protein